MNGQNGVVYSRSLNNVYAGRPRVELPTSRGQDVAVPRQPEPLTSNVGSNNAGLLFKEVAKATVQLGSAIATVCAAVYVMDKWFGGRR